MATEGAFRLLQDAPPKRCGRGHLNWPHFERLTGTVPHLAAMELGAARARALGVAATGAIAVFGALAIQGGHADRLNSLQNAARDEDAFTDLWVWPPGAYNPLRNPPPHGWRRQLQGHDGIARGTGAYRRARGSGLSFIGTVQRSNDAVTVRVRGRMSA
jgi:hypothetical protein